MCDGVTALGACDKRAKYVVRTGTRNHAYTHAACGVHLAQIIKAQLKRTRVVEVEESDE